MDSTCLKFHHPFTLIVSGPTSSGKTHLTRSLLSHHKLTTDINKERITILYCFGQFQDLFKHQIANTNTIYHEGLIGESELKKIRPDVVIIDDLMEAVGDSVEMTNLFTKGSHHLNISVCFIVQNLFLQSKYMRTISLNSHYIILLRNPRDKLQVSNLGRQIMPGETKFFNAVYNEATREPYTHLIIDLHPRCQEWAQLRQWKSVKGKHGFIVFERNDH